MAAITARDDTLTRTACPNRARALTTPAVGGPATSTHPSAPRDAPPAAAAAQDPPTADILPLTHTPPEATPTSKTPSPPPLPSAASPSTPPSAPPCTVVVHPCCAPARGVDPRPTRHSVLRLHCRGAQPDACLVLGTLHISARCSYHPQAHGGGPLRATRSPRRHSRPVAAARGVPAIPPPTIRSHRKIRHSPRLHGYTVVACVYAALSSLQPCRRCLRDDHVNPRPCRRTSSTTYTYTSAAPTST